MQVHVFLSNLGPRESSNQCNTGDMYAWIVIVVVVLILAALSIRTVDQATVGVVTMFGKYRRVLQPGLNFIIPFIERIARRISIQNQTEQLKFVAITQDQATVQFVATTIYAPKDHSEESVKQVAFTFVTPQAFLVAMTSAVEASVRALVATKQQAEVLGLREEIAAHAKETLQEQLSSWGYRLVDLTVNDIQFDQAVMDSMSKVVVGKNAQQAAEFQGQALLIQRTKEAEANGAFIRIGAQNEAEAARLRGVGLANFREELTRGLANSAKQLTDAGIDPSILSLAMYTETLAQVAKDGEGNVIFFDGSTTALEQTMKQLQALTVLNQGE